MKRILSIAFLILYLLPETHAQVPKSWGSAEIRSAINKLNTTGTVLYIAAHPDDENTRLLSYLVNYKYLRAGYLSITRGDGGQNLVGTEQGEMLGLLRTEELLAARRIDGAEQFFTRANDFGYSKNPEETFAFWNRDSILSDVVWVIRNFRPDIIITRFATDGSGGHGHHTASALLAEEAFVAAADPSRFPEQLQKVKPWQVRRLLYNRSGNFNTTNTDLSAFIKEDVGVYLPLHGKSTGEIAAESRSMHKSQGFGATRNRGSIPEYFKHLKGDSTNSGIVDGLDFSWKRIQGGEGLESSITKISDSFLPEQPSASIGPLISLYGAMSSIRDSTLRERKKKEVQEIILACAGFFAEATAGAPMAAAGDTVRINTTVINRSSADIILREIKSSLSGIEFDTTVSKSVVSSLSFTRTKVIRIPAGTKVTNPFWLNETHGPGMFTVKDLSLIGVAQQPPALEIILTLSVQGTDFNVVLPVRYKWVEPSDGERYRPFVIAPEVTVNFANDVVLFPGAGAKTISLRIKAGRDSVSGKLRLASLESWKADPAEMTFSLAKKGEEQDVAFRITPPATGGATRATAELITGTRQGAKSFVEIKHDYIPVQTFFEEASALLLKQDLKRNLHRIGYIAGAGDGIPQCLEQIGYDVTILDEKALDESDLGQYDAIVTGIRAFNTNENLLLRKPKLMAFVRAGGNLVVQYNTNSFLGPVKGDIGPYPFKISRDRVTREEAPVSFVIPGHPILHAPNKITSVDFNGWIQERGIYFASEWDSAYVAPLSMNDPGEKPLTGSTLIAQLGKGHFVYTGLAFFRQLPAGVPGAYRLFVNMIELGKN